MRRMRRARIFVRITETSLTREIKMSTTTDTRLDDIDALSRTIADLGGKAFDSIADAHGRDYQSTAAPWGRVCICGRTFTTQQGAGLHIAATRRQADEAMAGEMDRARMVLRLRGSWLRLVDTSSGTTMLTYVHRVEGSRVVTGVNAFTERTLAEWLSLGWKVQECGGRA